MSALLEPTTLGGAPAANDPAARQPDDERLLKEVTQQDGEAAIDNLVARRRVRRRVPRSVLADASAQLAIMVRSGVDLSSAIESLAEQCEHALLAAILRRVNESVVAGARLSDALAQHPEAFDATFVATVASAEASGKLATVLQQITDILRGEVRLSQSIGAMVTYPILLMVVSGGVVASLVIFVLPRFAQIFEDYEMDLPALTIALLAVSSELTVRWWLWLPLVAAACVGVVFAWTSEAGRRWIDGLALESPLVSRVLKPLHTSRMCRMISLLTNSGVPLLESVRLTRRAMTNHAYQMLLDDVDSAVTQGRNMASVLNESEIVPKAARQMLSTGEQTGNVGEVSGLVSEFYEHEAENQLRQLIRIAEPLITVVMGAIVAVVVLAVMLPVFDLSSVGGAGR
ncbi:Type II secretion system protein F [Pseudobythopirellula maris]|uniref:Type II secretion system protein F n=1 Tax=Pseudobythopirellula maris TaxID=2527991 RepID=A0A5C5ZP79_9BACT|nr:type II secretion system F family protein [Pseudobythopirellula maris]TWT88915.1 Type II secretion system protein F [Pseudobythopirellula maris]